MSRTSKIPHIFTFSKLRNRTRTWVLEHAIYMDQLCCMDVIVLIIISRTHMPALGQEPCRHHTASMTCPSTGTGPSRYAPMQSQP